MRLLISSTIFVLAAQTFAGPVKVHVEGEGLIRLAKDGQVVYASSATFVVSDHRVVEVGGAEPLPAIKIEGDAFTIDLEGNVLSGGTSAGRLVLGFLPVGSAITSVGNYQISSTRAKLGNPGEGTNGVIRVDGPARTVVQPSRSVATTHFAGRPSISVRPESRIKSDSFTLGDIAEVVADPALIESLKGVEIGRTPSVGVVRGLDAVTVQAKLRLAGFKPEQFSISIPNGARVVRCVQSVSPEQMLAAASESVQTKLGIKATLRLSGTVSAVQAPDGQLEIKVGSIARNADGFGVSVQIIVDGKPIQTRYLNLNVDGGLVNVPANTPVKIRVRMNGAALEIGGRTRSAAFVGQAVTVQTDTGSSHQGILIDPQTVEVKL